MKPLLCNMTDLICSITSKCSKILLRDMKAWSFCTGYSELEKSKPKSKAAGSIARINKRGQETNPSCNEKAFKPRRKDY
ncbi:hypothetical protein OPV22_013526 [Ensete ventricosum]|uniref:Uncharacterized protein n=1 Tax=Ensete ventricosum TaxID=4639 RepID=A0AAV8QZK2_ENSVE|nr:hypothetical protein OPV22_013526 [Ensete ventricosum]